MCSDWRSDELSARYLSTSVVMSLSDASGLCLLDENSANKLLVDSSEMSVCMCNGAADETDAEDGDASCLASDTMRFFSSCVSVTYGVKRPHWP